MMTATRVVRMIGIAGLVGWMGMVGWVAKTSQAQNGGQNPPASDRATRGGSADGAATPASRQPQVSPVLPGRHLPA